MRVTILTAAIVLLLAGPAGAATSTRCGALHGHDLDPSATARIVEAHIGPGRTRLLGCTLPQGRVRTLSPPLTTGERFAFAEVDAARGRFAVVEFHEDVDAGNGYSDMRAWWRVDDLQTGGRHAVWTYAYDAGTEHERLYDLGDPKRALLDAHGRALLAYRDEDDETNAIAAFTTTGRRHVLAQAPRASLPIDALRLTGETASWRLDGQPHSAALGSL